MMLVFAMIVGPAPSGAQPVAETTEENRSILSVSRIEVTLFGGTQGGGTFLALPAVADESRTFDTAADQVLDFRGDPLPGNFRAPEKRIEGGPVVGALTSFYLGSNFGMQLMGSYARSQASLTGFLADDPNEERFEYDRTDVDILSGGGNIVYNVGTERKMKIWPYVVLGFGGLLAKYPAVDDVGALYFLYGGGVSFSVGGSIRLQLGGTFTLFSYEQDEVNLNETLTFPAFNLGITWRHDVPEPVVLDGGETPPAETASGAGR